MALSIQGQDVQVCPLDVVPHAPFRRARALVDTSWEIIASLTTWHSWKARCTKALDGSQVHPSSTLASIWTDCIHTYSYGVLGKHARDLASCHLEVGFLS